MADTTSSRRQALREQSDDELQSKLAELVEERFRLRFRSATEAIENPMRFRALRRPPGRDHLHQAVAAALRAHAFVGQREHADQNMHVAMESGAAQHRRAGHHRQHQQRHRPRPAPVELFEQHHDQHQTKQRGHQVAVADDELALVPAAETVFADALRDRQHVMRNQLLRNSATDCASLPSAVLSARVTGSVAPNVGTKAECLPAPPITAISRSSAFCTAYTGASGPALA